MVHVDPVATPTGPSLAKPFETPTKVMGNKRAGKQCRTCDLEVSEYNTQHKAPEQTIDAGESSNSKARFLRNKPGYRVHDHCNVLCQFTCGNQAILCSPDNCTHEPKKRAKGQMSILLINF